MDETEKTGSERFWSSPGTRDAVDWPAATEPSEPAEPPEEELHREQNDDQDVGLKDSED